MILERIDHRHRILIKCRERCRDAIWWSNFSQAVKRNVFSLQEAQTPRALWASHHSTIGCAPMVKAGKLLWWQKNLSRVQVASVSKVFQFVFHANDVVALRPWDSLSLSVRSASSCFSAWCFFLLVLVVSWKRSLVLDHVHVWLLCLSFYVLYFIRL